MIKVTDNNKTHETLDWRGTAVYVAQGPGGARYGLINYKSKILIYVHFKRNKGKFDSAHKIFLYKTLNTFSMLKSQVISHNYTLGNWNKLYYYIILRIKYFTFTCTGNTSDIILQKRAQMNKRNTKLWLYLKKE